MVEEKDSKSPKTEALKVAPPSVSLTNNVKRFFASGTFTDLRIVCRGQEWPVHKLQVCGQSEVFYKMCTSSMKEGEESKIELVDDDPQVVGAMLHYLYHFDYSDYGNSSTDCAPIVFDVKMFAIADKYFIQPLKLLASKKFRKRCRKEWQTAAFAEAVAEAYDSSPKDDDTLKRTIIKIIKKNGGEIRRLAATNLELANTFRAIPDLGADVFFADHLSEQEQAGKEGVVDWYSCPSSDCQDVGRIFSVYVKCGYTMNFSCPTGCFSQNAGWWSSYKTSPPEKSSSDEDD